jgi:hypothetical protein
MPRLKKPRNYTPEWDAYEVQKEGLKGLAFSEKASDILSYGIESVKSFYNLYEKSRKSRKTKGGGTTHAEQDLLRSMIVFSATTLDGVIKQVIRYSISMLEKNNPEVKKEIEKFVERKMRSLDNELSINIAFIRDALCADCAKTFLIDQFIYELTGQSLQSPEEIFRAAKCLGIELCKEKKEKDVLKDIFLARNQIIHELDYMQKKAKKKQRNRRIRNRDVSIKWCEILLRLGKEFITFTAKNLPKELAK